MAHGLLLLWIAAVPLVLSPGPANVSLASVGVAYGFRRGLPYLAGILLGTLAVLVLVALGATGILLSRPVLAQTVKALALAYILYLAWRIATAPVTPGDTERTAVPSLWAGLLLALANPKAFAAIGAVYMGHQLVAGDVLRDAAWKMAALSFVIVLSGTVWLTFGALFSTLLRHAGVARAVNIAFAALLVISVGAALIA